MNKPSQMLVATSAEEAAEFVAKRFPCMALPLMVGYEPLPENVLCLTSQEQFDRAVPSFFEKIRYAHIAFILVESDEAAVELNRTERALLAFARGIFSDAAKRAATCTLPAEKAS